MNINQYSLRITINFLVCSNFMQHISSILELLATLIVYAGERRIIIVTLDPRLYFFYILLNYVPSFMHNTSSILDLLVILKITSVREGIIISTIEDPGYTFLIIPKLHTMYVLCKVHTQHRSYYQY